MNWYRIDIRNMTREQFDSWYAMADPDRRRKTDAFRQKEDRLRSIAGDHLARMGIAAHCGTEPAGIRFGRTGDGKPYAMGLDVHFNISHSGHLVVCAVSDHAVGIDVEQIRPVRSRLADKVCTPAELGWLREGSGWGETLSGEALIRFFQIWTSKEAYFKWAGTGITNLKAVDTLEYIRSGGTFQQDGCIISIYE